MIVDTIRERIQKCISDEVTISDEEFNELALELAHWQFENNISIRRYYNGVGGGPKTWKTWRDIPPFSVRLFKQLDVKTFKGEPEKMWLSSGTTGTQSKTYLKDTELYDLNIQYTKSQLSLTEHAYTIPLIPGIQAWPHSSLAYLFETMFGEDLSGNIHPQEDGTFQIDFEKVLELLEESVKEGLPAILYGTSYAFVQFFDWLNERNEWVKLLSGSMMIDTGGFKSITRTLSRREMMEGAEHFLGLQKFQCINEYGMSEMSSMFLNNSVLGHVGPSWVRTRVVDPLTFEYSPQRGVLALYDLSNVWSSFTLMTEDLADIDMEGDLPVVYPMGRAEGAELKGCSLTAERTMKAKAY